jgi:hypothetical protein
VDGLACPLHRPMVYNHLMRGHDLLSGTTLSHHATVDGGAFSWRGGVRRPWARIFDGVLTIRIPM